MALKRSVSILNRWTPQEVAEMDRYRGRLTRSGWLQRGHRLAMAQAREERANDELLKMLEPDDG